jgi:outer membrane protein
VNSRRLLRTSIAWACLASVCLAQDPGLQVSKPNLPIPIRSYVAPSIPSIRLRNSDRLHSLIRAGHLYLSLQDALALAIENNLNLEVDRYGPLLAESQLERNKAGGPIRGVPSASQQVASVDNGVGVQGSEVSAGLATGNGSGTVGGNGAASIQQVGQVTPNLDPILQNTSTFAHLSYPQSNLLLSQTNALIQSVHTYSTVLTQGLISGGLVQFRDYEQYLNENAPTDSLNPAVGPYMSLYFRHNLLQGFGVKVNNRLIRIAQINIIASREVFRSQLLDLAASVINLYWGLVSATDELRIRQAALEATQKFYEETKKEVEVGAIPRVQLPRAEAEFSSRRQDLSIAQQGVQQQATLLKEAISHTEDPLLEAAEIVPLDHVEVPATDDLPPLRQLVATAMTKRPDVAVAKYRDQTQEIALAGTENPLLPSLAVQGQTYDRGVAGTPHVVDGVPANPYFAGGYGTALGQIVRHDFPNYLGGAGFSIPVHNRQAQGDYGIDQLQYRQSEVSSQRDTNQIVVDISNQLSALRQSRARYSAARETRALQEQVLAEDRKKFSYGIATFNDLIVDQRTLVAAQISEINAMANFARARASLDQVLGETLERNRISLDEGLNGRVAGESRVPDNAPDRSLPVK